MKKGTTKEKAPRSLNASLTQVWKESAAMLRDATIKERDSPLKTQSTTALLLSREKRNEPTEEQLQEFVDTALKDIAEKITTKRQLATEVAALRVAVSEAQKEKQQRESSVKSLKKELQVAIESDNKNAQAIVQLENLLTIEQRKKDTLQQEVHDRVHDLNSSYKRVQTLIQQKKVMLARQQKATMDEQYKLLQEQERLEEADTAADATLTRLTRAMSESKVAEHARMKVLREKARILHSLIAKEGVPHVSDKLTKEIASILKASPATATPSSHFLTSHK